MIELQNIELKYGHNYVFSNFSVSVPENNIVSILGHNGAGKTTFLKLIEGSLLPQKGKVKNTYKGKKTFFLSEKGNLYDDMSLRENLKFLQLLKEPFNTPNKTNKNIDFYIEKLSLIKHMDKKVSELSSGLKTRATILVGLIFDPDLILLDEPTNTIDPMSKKILVETIKHLASKGKKIIIVTHDLDFCYEISESNMILNEGIIIREEIVDRHLITADEFKRKYLEYTEEVEEYESNII